MKLYLVRHATPVSDDVDPERPLSREGIAEAASVAGKLRGMQVDMIYHSGKLRARQTAEAFAAISGITPEEAHALMPNDDPSIWAGRLRDMQGSVMLVGHLPYMARLTGLLVKNNPTVALLDFYPATVACLERKDGDWILVRTLIPQ